MTAGGPPRLNRARLAVAGRAGVEVPAPALLDLPERVLQFGTGAFLRGFVESFIDDANRRGTFAGRVVAVASTESGGGRHRDLEEQDGLYTLVTRAGNGAQKAPRVIAAVSRVLAAASQWDSVLACARSPHLELVFSNTTEVGIAADNADNADAADANPPRSFPGKLTRFLAERARAFNYDADRGVAVVPCELIEDNGDRLREVVLAIAKRWALDPRFFEWLDAAVPFCNTLVDRIVPSLSDESERRALEERLGYSDALLTICEPYRLFAIQTDARARRRFAFASGDPGIILCHDVTPYRERKLRLLNGSHTIMASLGLLAGCRTVNDAMANGVGDLVRRAMREEIIPTLDVPDAAGYADDVLTRFANPALRHDLLDISLQATAKMRARIVPTILAYARVAHAPPAGLTLGFAALLLCLRGDLDAAARRLGRAVPPDEHGGRIRDAWASASDAETVARRVCADHALWGPDLEHVPGFVTLVAEYLGAMDIQGVTATIERVNQRVTGRGLAAARG